MSYKLYGLDINEIILKATFVMAFLLHFLIMGNPKQRIITFTDKK